MLCPRARIYRLPSRWFVGLVALLALKRLGRGHVQPSRPADPLTSRGAVNPLQKRGVKPHIDGRLPGFLFGNRRRSGIAARLLRK